MVEKKKEENSALLKNIFDEAVKLILPVDRATVVIEMVFGRYILQSEEMRLQEQLIQFIASGKS